MQRLFFALWPDAVAREALVRVAADVARGAGGRPPREDNLHMTVAFLGSVDEARVGDVRDAGERGAASAPPFDVVLERLGGNRRGVAWFAPAAVPPALAALHDALAAALDAAGFALERREFRPHVTLARDCARPLRGPAAPAIAWRADALSLVASTPAPGGSRYRDLASWRLGGARPP